MDRFQLATLVDWAGDKGFCGRKRLQKVVYFLQRAGCPLNADFLLHRYGPYSRDVANVCDDMVAANLLQQREEPNPAGVQYCYSLAPQTRIHLEAGRKQHPDRAREMAPFHARASELIAADLWELELGSTILFFREQDQDWRRAISSACAFKHVSETLPETIAAASLARRIAEYDPAIAT